MRAAIGPGVSETRANVDHFVHMLVSLGETEDVLYSLKQDFVFLGCLFCKVDPGKGFL